MKYSISILLGAIALFYSCSSNEFSPEYQKELPYDGCKVAIDTISMKTYTATQIGDSIIKHQLYDETTKWYDLQGYHSMTHSVSYLPGGERYTIEKIVRDDNSLPTARDISVESATIEPLVTLSRLKQRKAGHEEWLFRHYLDPQKYLEDASIIFYSENERTFKKKQSNGDSLLIKGIDRFDKQGRIVYQFPVKVEEQAPFIKTYYHPDNNYIDSIQSIFYIDNDSTRAIIKSETERYKYDWNEKNIPAVKYTYRNDSLTHVTEFQYGYRK